MVKAPQSVPVKRTLSSTDTATPIVVAVGSSAGGIEPVLGLVSALRKTGTYCVVLAQHLSATNASVLPELVRRRTSLSTKTIEHWEPLKPDTVYVTPPGFDVVFEAGHLLLVAAARRITPQPSVDQLFESLANSGLAPRTLAIVLSGLGSDGSKGLHTLKRAGALTMVQRPADASSPDMPEASLATGCVDFWGSVEQLGEALMTSIERLHLPATAPDPAQLALLISACRTGGVDYAVDFFSDDSLAQMAQLRGALLGLNSLADYAQRLALDSSEAEAFLRQLLQPIGSFDQSVPQRKGLLSVLVDEYLRWSGPDPFRVWSVGCASGEEPYAMAFALQDARARAQHRSDFLIYATDLLPEQISLARAGTYTPHELQGLPEDIVGRYLGRRLKHLQVNLDLRRKILFSVHDAMTEPAWPALNFIACLGILPSLRPRYAQQLLLKLAAAVRRGGVLFTGAAEG